MSETGLIRFISQGDRFYRAQLVKQLEPNANEFQESEKLRQARGETSRGGLSGWVSDRGVTNCQALVPHPLSPNPSSPVPTKS